jgi:type IV pilus assembly protein PilY1
VAIYDNPRSFGGFVQQTQTNTTCPAGAPETICSSGQLVRTSSSNVVNFATDNGWYIDLPDGVGASDGSGSERANTDPALALGTLGFTTNVPNSNACTVGGFSYRYFLDYRTGAAVSTSTGNIVATRLGNALATRPVYVRLPNNTVVELTRLSDGTTITSNVPIGGGAGATRRTSWRELIKESE